MTGDFVNECLDRVSSVVPGQSTFKHSYGLDRDSDQFSTMNIEPGQLYMNVTGNGATQCTCSFDPGHVTFRHSLGLDRDSDQFSTMNIEPGQFVKE